MENIFNDAKTKELLTEVLIELLQNRRKLMYAIVLEALEEVGLANAITEGRQNDFIPEAEIFAILDAE